MTLAVGDCRATLAQWAREGVVVQCVVTSPPYWSLRDYGVAGQLGLEATPGEYVENMVEVFRLVREVLAEDGTVWLNLGDSYAQSPLRHRRDVSDTDWAKNYGHVDNGVSPAVAGLKPKDLVGIPWRVAFALQADGWWLRSDMIWAKPNPMPESVVDRPTKAHEYLFLLTKRERYYYDAAAIREPTERPDPIGRPNGHDGRSDKGRPAGQMASGNQGACAAKAGPAMRNRRSVWTIATAPYPEAHFATFPPDLVKPCVLAGTSERGCCPACGRQWAREQELAERWQTRPGTPIKADASRNDHGRADRVLSRYETTAWAPGCACGLAPVPSTVLDIFMGAGTVAMVAQDLGRRWLGCELNPEYAALCERRTRQQGLVLAAAGGG